jgi:hypothetical protein
VRTGDKEKEDVRQLKLVDLVVILINIEAQDWGRGWSASSFHAHTPAYD